jgi:hypothetical protein
MMVDRFWLLTHSVFAIDINPQTASVLSFLPGVWKRFGTSGNWYLSTWGICKLTVARKKFEWEISLRPSSK